MKLGDIDLNVDPGEGNLNLRAYLAAIVGPQRIAHGKKKTINVPRRDSGNAALIARNQVGQGGKQALFVACSLPERAQQDNPNFPEQTGFFHFSDNESMGDGSYFTSVAPLKFIFFEAVLLPGDSLFAGFSSIGGGYDEAPAQYPLFVSEVWF